MTALAVSNIAWSYANRLRAYDVLKEHDIDGLEIAPGLLFAEEADPFEPSPAGLNARLRELETAGLRLVSMQSLLFGVEGAELFGQPDAVDRLVHGLKRAIKLAGRTGIPNLVFGSPRQRITPPGMTAAEIADHARNILRRLGDLAAANRTVLALEPNPAEYGTNFMTNYADTLEMVKVVDHPNITLNFDVGALHMTSSFPSVAAYLREARTHISHVHLSAPFLGPAPASAEETAEVLAGLADIGFDRAASIEMKADSTDEIAALSRSVQTLRAGIDLAGRRQ
jgi:sugar phosphate isomerase/epimerase